MKAPRSITRLFFKFDITITMEVASPLSFAHAAGSKRLLPCSPPPGIVDSTNCPAQDSMEEYQQRSFKRRRFAVDESMGLSGNENTTIVNQSPFLSHNTLQHQRINFATSASSNGKVSSCLRSKRRSRGREKVVERSFFRGYRERDG